MKADLFKTLQSQIMFLDGGAGSILQELGLPAGVLPETWNIDNRNAVVALNQGYLTAGSNIILTNTFGANCLKYDDEGTYSLEAVVNAAVSIAKEAVRRCEENSPLDERLAAFLKDSEPLRGTPACDRAHFVALDIGPTGKLLKPLGDLAFEDAVNVFKKTIEIGVKAGVDLIYIETMNDSHEAKAAVLAAKEVCDLPVFITTVYDGGGKLLTGANPETMVAILEGLRVDALGMNCSLGPAQMMGIVPRLAENSSTPVIVKPNAGLPRSENGKTVYDVGPDEFASLMRQIVEYGANIVGGCCGTTPAHIRALVNATQDMAQHLPEEKNISMISSYTHAVRFGRKPILIGERINPTGKKKFKEALRNHDIDYIISEGLKQEAAGVDALDVNVGLPEIDEPAMMDEVVRELQAVLDLPLQIDTTNAVAMEKALRIYNGKALINSVNGKAEIMAEVFPLVKKYGGVCVALTIDEDGIPTTAEGRIKIVEKIYANAAKYGIKQKDIIIDPLCMTVSSDDQAAVATLKALKYVHDVLGGNTILGVSNISFGLPSRDIVNGVFFTMAMQAGLSAAIMNPSAAEMRKAYTCFCTLSGYDPQCLGYIEYASNLPAMVASAPGSAPDSSAAMAPQNSSPADEDPLIHAVRKGLKTQSEEAIRAKLNAGEDPMLIINDYLIKGLDIVGKGFEAKTVYLPQLLMSADAAKAAFAVIKDHLEKSGAAGAKKGKIVLATVKGDIHDIGKNIVKVLLENYSYDVIDLGKDVEPQLIVDTVIKDHIMLVGLSALMTTTVPAMEETIKLLREQAPWAKVCVGGAVLTQEYADMIGADRYSKDAMNTVEYAKEILG